MKIKKFTPIEDILKYEIAQELDLTEKIEKYGWGELTAIETGRIGGYVGVRKRKILEEIAREKKS